jgi:uncharacterized membrane protein
MTAFEIFGPGAPRAHDPVPRDGEAVLFDAVLRPHRSLGPRGFLLLMAAFGALSFVAGIAFVSAGAWPVVGFFGLDILLVYVAFKASYRSGRMTETVRLTERALEVREVDPGGRERSWRFQPYWLRVEMDDPPEHDSQLTLRSHGRGLVIGAFLAPEERLDLANALRDALSQLRRGTGAPAGA